jgi:hypothetical protein
MANPFQISTLVHNNIDIIKKTLFDNGSMTAEDLVEFIQGGMLTKPSKKEAMELYIIPPLTKQKYFKKNQENKWELVFEEIPEHQIVKDILIEIKRPMTIKEIKRELKKQDTILSNLSTVTLDRDANFIKLKGEYWALVKWNIVNDDAYEILGTANSPLTKDEIYKKINKINWNKNKEIIFAPEIDERFVKVGKKWSIKNIRNKIKNEQDKNSEMEKIIGLIVGGSKEQKLECIVGLKKDGGGNIDIFLNQKEITYLDKLIEELIPLCRNKDKEIQRETISLLGEFGRPIYNKKSVYDRTEQKRERVVDYLLDMLQDKIDFSEKQECSHIINQLLKIKRLPKETVKVKSVVMNIPNEEDWNSIKHLAAKL